MLGWSSIISPTLKIGDTAPALAELTWLQGTPVTKYEPGRVYVVEFWATWCPPCLKAIPHLSALQKQYADKLTIISVNAEGPRGTADTIYNFMKRHGKEMAYTVAMQDLIKMPMSEAWISAGGSMGLPTAGIVDARGRLAWMDIRIEARTTVSMRRSPILWPARLIWRAHEYCNLASA